jgi:uncharacterized protein YozE (UPF0346 family)
MNTASVEPIRYYVHGDASENEPFHFYCATCDAFDSAAHFNEERHTATRAARYEQSLKAWRGLNRNYPGKYRRPKDAENWLADDAAADKRKAKAARSPFFTWLLRQAGRDDPVGDLANDSMRDTSFPVSVTSEEPLRNHLRRESACDEALVALDEAFEEFRMRPRAREGVSLALRFRVFKEDDYRCQLCGGTNARENLWTLCFECNRGKRTHEV